MRSARPCRLCKVRNPPSVSLRGEKCSPEGIEGGERVVVFFSLTRSQCIVYPKQKRVRKGRREVEKERGKNKREKKM